MTEATNSHRAIVQIAKTIIGTVGVFLVIISVSHGLDTKWDEWPVWTALFGTFICMVTS